ncbi:MAG TPA: universal stress protein [Bosea sp. (in: a-proteobacteria)]|jgi:nucleotide-binding universal stress UspA family protein|uniref:universal stress protein n=1 Tax=Bosea sp. (in: a-proteobacteria) TaxID=1871050 RepID=UPI002E10931C|nr:universal stress protein [Bosea sp. (in: a-proteobacteria)]
MRAPIVLATDLTARSDRAFDRAVALARQWGSRLVIVHVLENLTSEQDESARARAGDALKDLVDDLDVPHETIVELGSLPETVSAIADGLQASVIVVGAARYNHVTDFFLGTAIDYLARYSAIPILIVKERVKQPYDGIVVGTDFSERSKEALIGAAGLFPELPIKLANGYPQPFPGRIGIEAARAHGEETAREEAEAFLDNPDLASLRDRIDLRFAQTSASDAIARMAAGLKQPLVVLGGRGRGAVLHALLGNRASELTIVLPYDVLVVRQKPPPAVLPVGIVTKPT